MNIRKTAAIGAVVAAGALVLSGCTNPYTSEVIEGTSITVAYNDNFFNYNDDSSAGNNTANGNVRYMTSSDFAYYDATPELIRNTDFGSFEKISDDPLTVEYTINSNVKWSDGTDVDEADMLLQWAALSGNVTDFAPASTAGLSLVTATPEVDDHKMTLVYDDAYVDWELAFGMGVSAHGTVMLAYPDEYPAGEEDAAKADLITAIQEGDTEWLAPVVEVWNNGYGYTTMPDNELLYLSSGPYIVSDIAENEFITLTANPEFSWGPSPHYETITIRTISDSTAALQALENGDIQIWTGQPTADILELAQGLAGVNVESGVQAAYEHIDLTFNNGGPFDPATYGGDEETAKLVRQAFLLTLPREEIVDKIISPLNPDASVRDSQLVIPGAPSYDGIVAENGSDFYATTDIDAAKALLEQAGVDTPIDVNFWYPEGNVRRGQEFELAQASAALAGFNVIDTSEPDWAFTDPEAFPVNPHDVVVFAWASTSLAISGSDQIFACYDEPLNKAGNYNGYCNPTVDELLATLEVTSDPDTQADLQLQIEQELWGDAYGATLYQFPGLWVSSDTVTGVKGNPLSPDYFWNFWEWAPADA
ncbi:MAG: peptide transporter [Leifsonia sp.]|nr:peptide transporter [Leifsonia sp.]|tara:strand:- start:77156 stop:78931 length:1776 start_codon:yes stop_codon:yes gene_type:complete